MNKKIFTVDFEPVWPVGGALVIIADNLEEAKNIASHTIQHTDEFKVEEVDITNSGVILYHDGDY